MRIYPLFLALLIAQSVFSQKTGVIQGKITAFSSNQPVEFATLILEGTALGAQTDEKGDFTINDIPAGFYNIRITCVGYTAKTLFEVEASNSKPTTLQIELEPSVQQIKEVEVKSNKNPFTKREESPLSVRTIGTNEIQRAPGGNRDISRVIQALPGVGFTASFRNDILIRGGAPSENRFYIDGVEIPNINHFATQGASGGPVGLINVDFIREVNFYSGAFPANRGNTLSSVMDIRMREGRDDRFGLTATLGSSDFALSMEGPLDKNKKANFIASARVSYLQFLFRALGLPFLPTYFDGQFKVKYKINERNDLIFIGLGAYDFNRLNTSANRSESQKYLLRVLPEQDQWNYTLGVRYNHYFKGQTFTLVLSRNMLKNIIFKYKDNNQDSLKTLDFNSFEAENKLRAEITGRKGAWKYNYGLLYEFAHYENQSNLNIGAGTPLEVSYATNLFLHKWAVFGTVSRSLLNERISLSLGVRADGSSYNSSMASTWSQLSPRFSASFQLMEGLRLNMNTGYYHQLPAYTSMGFQNNGGERINQNTLTYIRNVHAVLGAEYTHKYNGRISVEGFFKQYYNYPFITQSPQIDSINLANLGSEFGVVGDYPLASIKQGRSYGMEMLYEQKLTKGWFGIASYTLFWSEFQDKNDKYVPSSWDTRHIISITAGKKFKKGWEVGIRFRATGGQPFTPYDTLTSSLRPVWDNLQQGVRDYDQLNTQRLPWFHNLDIRASKRWYFKKWSLELYVDIQNLYAFKALSQPVFTAQVDADGNAVPAFPGSPNYAYRFLQNSTGNPIPTLGFIISY